jgi:6-pyruvoyltetrahydropterin/6-carboxytetrahydropterin synthase
MPNLLASCQFSFAASHFLTKYHGKCENLHGHNYKLIITVQGPLQEDGMVMDFKLLKKAVEEKVVALLDHTHLNDRFENPSAENVAVWIWDRLKGELPLAKIWLYETDTSYVEYEGA